MGFFFQFKRSAQKSKLMTRLISALNDSRDAQETDCAIKNFYDYINCDYILGPIIKKYGADYLTIKKLILALDEAVGGKYGGWYKNQYIPVSTFGFSESLECALKNYYEGSSIELILYEVQQLM